MAHKIEKAIVGVGVHKPDEQAPGAANESPQLEVLHEHTKRPEQLAGTTYKIKPPVQEHALYVTINDIVMNAGTEHEHREPFEMFINSKNMEHFQWTVALTRVVSGVFRKGGDVTFLVEELKSVYDPHGGYWRPGGRFMPSLIAEIGDVIERHLKSIGVIAEEPADENVQALIAEKRAEYEARRDAGKATEAGGEEDSGFPAEAVLCKSCSVKAAVMMDGCLTCLSCGSSKCH